VCPNGDYYFRVKLDGEGSTVKGRVMGESSSAIIKLYTRQNHVGRGRDRKKMH